VTASATRHVFTEYVNGLEPGKAPTVASFERLWQALGAALRSELHRRGLAHGSPAFLGIYGHATWSEPAFDELLTECYSFVFLDRWRSLKGQLAVKPNVDGLVFLNIRHFLHERQERHDPLGYQVFRGLHSVVTSAVEQGELRVLGGDPRVRNETTLAFVTAERAGAERDADVAEVVLGWSDGLAPLFVDRRGPDVPSRLAEALRELRRLGVEQFRFRDLLDPLKTAARRRCAALLEFVPRPAPGEDDESFRALVTDVAEAIEALDVDARRREHLRRLWQFVAAHAADPGTDPEDVPSFRKTGTQLQIPRETLPSLYATLAPLVRKQRTDRSRGTERRSSTEAS